MQTIGKLLTSIVLLSALSAHADEARFHAGVSLGGVVGLAQDNRTNATALNPTLHIDLGVRIDPQTAIYARAEVGSIVLANQAALYLVGEWQALRWLSLATGIGWDGMASMSFGEANNASLRPMGPGTAIPDYYSTSNSWSAISIPVIVGIQLSRSYSGARALRLDLEGAGGWQSSTNTYGWHTSVSLGWSWN
jgi:hypothetical protein